MTKIQKVTMLHLHQKHAKMKYVSTLLTLIIGLH
jgi:hypothetical protein